MITSTAIFSYTSDDETEEQTRMEFSATFDDLSEDENPPQYKLRYEADGMTEADNTYFNKADIKSLRAWCRQVLAMTDEV